MVESQIARKADEPDTDPFCGIKQETGPQFISKTMQHQTCREDTTAVDCLKNQENIELAVVAVAHAAADPEAVMVVPLNAALALLAVPATVGQHNVAHLAYQSGWPVLHFRPYWLFLLSFLTHLGRIKIVAPPLPRRLDILTSEGVHSDVDAVAEPVEFECSQVGGDHDRSPQQISRRHVGKGSTEHSYRGGQKAHIERFGPLVCLPIGQSQLWPHPAGDRSQGGKIINQVSSYKIYT